MWWLRLGGLLLIMLLIAALVLLSITIGAKAMSLTELLAAKDLSWQILRGHSDVFSALAAGSQREVVENAGIIATLRFPRTALAALVGLSLGIAGAVIQGLTRNPLADPGILGISAGGAVALTAGVYLLGVISLPVQIMLSCLGAALAAAIIFGLAASTLGQGDTVGLVLAGAALSAMLAAVTAGIIFIDPNALEALRQWQTGAVTGRNMHEVLMLLPLLLLGSVLALALAPRLNILSLGAEAARGLGVHVGRTFGFGVVVIALLAGVATAAAGPIAFLALVVPHIARSITGPDFRWMLPYSGLIGAAMLLGADIVGRVVLSHGEVQAGILVALVGAPCFVILVRQRKLVAL